mmetsp:Transcript_7993/g.29554  ORF Transcript_7993/g.29554 Transcript_7993/m.29554 type:complete len:349 (+) Transcript_7993:114-1160(+)
MGATKAASIVTLGCIGVRPSSGRPQPCGGRRAPARVVPETFSRISRKRCCRVELMPREPSRLVTRAAFPGGITGNSSQFQTSGDKIQVIVKGCCSELGLEVVKLVARARDLEVAGAVDQTHIGDDIGLVAGLSEPLELPVTDDLTVAMASISQNRKRGVLVELQKDTSFELVIKHSMGFGISPVLCDSYSLPMLQDIMGLCEKASVGCIVLPDTSVGAALMRQAAAAATAYYGRAEIVESSGDDKAVSPSVSSELLAKSLSGAGQWFEGNTSLEGDARGKLIEDGVRVHSMRVPGLQSSQEVVFGRKGERYTLKLEQGDRQGDAPGILMAVRRVVHLKSMVYGMERIL